MAHIEEPSFQSEWNDLQALRQLSATSGLRQMKPSVTTSVSKKSSNNADEKEAIKRDGQAVLKNHQRLGDIVTEIEKTQKSCNEIRQQIEQLTQNIASLKSSTHDRLEEAQEKRRKVEALSQMLESKEGKWDSEKTRLENYIKLAKDHLGLEILPTNNFKSFIFSMTNLDKSDPERKFLCEITLGDSGTGKQKYSVVQILPEVDGLEAIVETLNETGELSGFVVKLREKFRSAL